MIDILDHIYFFTNLQLAFFGVAMTVFTVLFSFIINKKNDLKFSISKKRSGDDSPSLHLNIAFLKNQIKTLKRINSKLLLIIMFTFFFLVISYLIAFFFSVSCWLYYFDVFFVGILFLEFFFGFYIIWKLILYYLKVIKISE